MDAKEYSQLLMRARKNMPEVTGTGERFVMPDMDVLYEGKTTIIKNFDVLLDKMNRPSDHAVPVLLREIGIAGSYDSGRLLLQGRVPERTLVERVSKYIETYVICGECGRPDTHLVKEERTTLVKCDACGGHRPVKSPKKAAQQRQPDAVEEGKVYECMIEDTGKRGDGIARREKYTIFVEGGQKGQVVKVKINRVSGSMAFGEVFKG